MNMCMTSLNFCFGHHTQIIGSLQPSCYQNMKMTLPHEELLELLGVGFSTTGATIHLYNRFTIKDIVSFILFTGHLGVCLCSDQISL